MNTFETMTFNVDFEEDGEFNCSMDPEEEFHVDFGDAAYNEYHGIYTVTPSASTQVLLTANKNLSQNITIEPIPNNYGLITWNGSYLTVS